MMKTTRTILTNSDIESLALMKRGDLVRHLGDQISVLKGFSHEQRDSEIIPVLNQYGLHIEAQVRNYHRSGKFPEYPRELDQ